MLQAEKDPRIFIQVRDFLKALNSGNGKPIEMLSPKDARQVLTSAQQSVTVNYSGIEETTQTITQDGETVTIHITKPAGSKPGAPVFIYIHGGGWVLGDYPTHRRLVRDLVVESGAVAVFPDYTPSPEAQYPVAINQIYAVTKWVAAHGDEIGVDGKNLAVVGNSVGGNMTAAVALMAKEKKGPEIKLQVLLWPVTDANFETASYNELGEGRFLTKKMMVWFWENYLPDETRRQEIYASPLQADVGHLKGLPPALVQTAENDVLRDEGEAYARKLDEAGVPVTLTRYAGLIHDYGLLNPLAHIPAVKTALLQAAAAIKKSLFILLLSFLSLVTNAQVKNIVLVHGAFADGSSWSGIIPILQSKGYQVIAVQNPLTSLEDDVAATKRAIALMDGPVLLVGHSYGGMVITEAGNDPKVAGLLYVCALIPNDGQTVVDVVSAFPAAPGSAEFKPDASGFLSLSFKGIDQFFAQDLNAQTRKLIYATQVPWAAKATTTPISTAAWKNKPSWTIIGTEDKMVPTNLARAEATMIKATTLELKASHVPMLSMPGKVADFIISATTKL